MNAQNKMYTAACSKNEGAAYWGNHELPEDAIIVGTVRLGEHVGALVRFENDIFAQGKNGVIHSLDQDIVRAALAEERQLWQSAYDERMAAIEAGELEPEMLAAAREAEAKIDYEDIMTLFENIGAWQKIRNNATDYAHLTLQSWYRLQGV